MSSVLVERVLSVVEVLLVPDVVLVGELSRKGSLVPVGVEIFHDFPRGIFDSDNFIFNFG